MSKLLVLLYFSLIVSNSICTECECDPSENNGEDKDNYICVKSGGSCDWVLLCEHATKTTENEETFKCSDYAVTEANQENYYCGESTETACKEIPYCVGNTEGDCTTFKVVPSKSETLNPQLKQMEKPQILIAKKNIYVKVSQQLRVKFVKIILFQKRINILMVV